MGWDHYMGFGGGFMWVIWILVIAAIVWLVVAMSRQDRSSGEPSPREILDRRYARGEIDKETYQRMKDELD
ncbi:SHOCT domain-containing protein [Guyparkeria sp. SCN-R1]|uniref:SHOCT domain-containing protein n=1 Tax=unclassified Guyparkeria TaxID=2626246 RepID=UPI000F65602F|nr:SHOCT domain-containing protein [Guyparkeria sp. SCN-R1]RRQ23828.1 SHOCT domain-containing protein [Guyparkeria sp. SCN-R1]